MDYIYHGDKLTDPALKKKPRKAVRRSQAYLTGWFVKEINKSLNE